MSLTRVCTSFCHFIWTAFKFKTELLNYPKPKGQPQHGIFSSSDAGAAYGPNDLTPLLPGMNDEPRRVLKEDDHSENKGAAEDLAKLVAPDASSEKEIGRLGHERIADLERLLPETLAAQTERDRHAAQLTDELSQKSALLEQAEANAAEAKERAGVELRELRAKLDESLLSRDHALEKVANATEEKERAGVELRELRAKLDELLLSRDHALEQVANSAEERKRAGVELRGLRAELDKSLLSRDHALEQVANTAEERRRAGVELRGLRAELDKSLLSRDHALEQVANAAEEKKHAGWELRELRAKHDELLLSRNQALEQDKANAAEEGERTGLELRELRVKLDELLLSSDHALERAQSALQKLSCAAEAKEQSQRELTEMRAELEANMSESALALRLRLADMENGCVKSIAEADTYRIQSATGLINTDELMERMQALEAEMASLQRGGTREAWLG